MQNVSPIIPWLGGKRRLADKLIPLFPPHECYVEVFCGGAALYFLRPPAQVEVLNDINGELVNLYRVVQHHLEEFVRQFKWAISSRQVFKWQQATKPETLTDIQRAARSAFLLPATPRLRWPRRWPELRHRHHHHAGHQPLSDRGEPERRALASGWHLYRESTVAGLHEALRPRAQFFLPRPALLADRGLRRSVRVGAIRGNGRRHAYLQRQGNGQHQRPS